LRLTYSFFSFVISGVLKDVLFPKVDAKQKYQQKNNIDEAAAPATSPNGVLKDLEQVSSLTAGIIGIGKDP
jgi:hypothetical protein